MYVEACQRCLKLFEPLTPSTCFNIYIMSPYSAFWVSFNTFNKHSITALTVYFELLSTPSTYIAFDQFFIVQYIISHLQHLWHQSISFIQSIYIVDSNSKYLNYMKIQLKSLNYNKLQNNGLNNSYFELNPVKFPLNWWNFKLTMLIDCAL